jgi:integrase
LAHCAAQGHNRRGLQKIAWLLLVVASSLRVRQGRVSIAEIERAARRRARFSRHVGGGSGWTTQQPFKHVATAWLRFVGRLADPPAPRPPFADHVEAFARFMREERGLSPVTIVTRCQRVEHFLTTVRPRLRSLKHVSVSQVDYLIRQGRHGWSRPAMATLASHLRSFFRYAEAQRWCRTGLAAAIDSPTIYRQEGLPQGPTWEQVQQLIRQTAGDRPTDIRARAIVLLLALYGLRRGEVARLRLDDIDWVDETICVTRPKQRRVQRYPLLQPVGQASSGIFARFDLHAPVERSSSRSRPLSVRCQPGV